MASTAELTTSAYKVPDDLAEVFSNLATFAKNMTVKDSEKFASYETDPSLWFGDKLLKYYNGTLTEKEVK